MLPLEIFRRKMKTDRMKDNDQDQKVGDGGAAIQAGGNVAIVNVGLTYEQVKEIALDIFRSNFYQLSGEAKEIAKCRAEEITEKFLRELAANYPNGYLKSSDPDFQHSLFTVQKEYARTGDKDLGDILVDLLVDRSKQSQRSILQIVLNESLATAPKLTEQQLAVLGQIFLYRYTQATGIFIHEQLGKHFDRFTKPFLGKLVKNDASFQHLEFCACGSSGMGKANLESALGKVYAGLFFKGFDEAELTNLNLSITKDSLIFAPCINDLTKLQIAAQNEESLDEIMEQLKVPDKERPTLKRLYSKYKMSESEIRAVCVRIRPYMEELFDVWSSSKMKSFTLTSVGIGIGHANVKRMAGEFADLSIWIN